MPWDQLAYWAVTVGTQIAGSVPLLGEKIQFLMLGGHTVGQATLLRFYVLHCYVLPALTVGLIAYHMWRIRKDGGLAVTDRVVEEAKQTARLTPAPPGKTYTLLGVTPGETVQAQSPAGLLHERSRPGGACHRAARRGLVHDRLGRLRLPRGVLAGTARRSRQPLGHPPIRPRRPWYFLWLQELVSILTFRVGDTVIDGAFLGGVLVPGLLLGALAAWPFLDRSPIEAAGVWFHPSRRRQNRVFLTILLICVVLTIVGTYFRGAYWGWVWPWDAVPHGHGFV